MTAIRDARHQAHEAAQLRERGVLTAATVLKSGIAEAASDLAGLTTVTFRDEAGQTILTTVSRRYINQLARIRGDLDVIYDPAHPSHVMTPAALGEYNGARTGLLVEVTVSTLVLIVCLATLLPAVKTYKVAAHQAERLVPLKP